MHIKTLAAITAAITLSSTAFAHEPGNFIVRAGVMYSGPKSDSSGISVNGSDISGSKVKTSGSGQLINLSGTWIFAPHFGLEAMVGGGFLHELRARGTGGNPRIAEGRFAEVMQQPITATVQFFFLDPKSGFQPYIGVGLNYTMFYGERFTRRQRRLGYKRDELDVKNAWGWAAQVGADIALTDKLYLNAAVWRLDVEAKAKGEARNGDEIKFKMNLDPWIYSIGVGYKF
jgi:outer membrane protein